MAKHRAKRYKKIIKQHKFLQVILVIAIILAVIYIVKFLLDIYTTRNETDLLSSIQVNSNDITDETTERMLQVRELQKENSDIVGWLEIGGTNINYPVVQGEDNSFYMTHDYKKDQSSSGSLFLDKDYDWSIPSSNLLIYGHNNRDGLMFEELLKYENEEFYKEHPIIRFTTGDEDAEYEIISAFKSRVYYRSEKNVFRYYYFINAENEEEYNEFVKNAKEADIYDTGKTAEYGDQLITLSTCSYHTEDGRFAVVGRKIDNKE